MTTLNKILWKHVKVEHEQPLTVDELRCLRDVGAELTRLRGIEAALLFRRTREEAVNEHRRLATVAYWQSGMDRHNAIADALEAG